MNETLYRPDKPHAGIPAHVDIIDLNRTDGTMAHTRVDFGGNVIDSVGQPIIKRNTGGW